MGSEMTIKQLADELHIDKQKVYRFIVKNHITASRDVMQTKYYDEAAQKIIISAFDHITTSKKSFQNSHRDVLQKSSNDIMLTTLINEISEKNKQLSEKDAQINALNDRLKEITAALVSAQQTAQAAQALHAGTIKKQLEEQNTDSEDGTHTQSEKKQSILSRLFRKEEKKKDN